MAKRPVFLCSPNGTSLVQTCYVEFQWHPGLSVSQKQKSIESLHDAARSQLGVGPLLEISSKSTNPAGIALSAFNLTLDRHAGGHPVSVECAFQSSKVFEHAGPFRDLLQVSSRDAKRDERLRNSGKLKCFDFDGTQWELEPQTAFYDWLYISALNSQPDLANKIAHFAGFTDIEFNPEKSVNCQAYSVALYQSLQRSGLLEQALSSPQAFLACIRSRPTVNAHQDDTLQGRLF